MHQYIANRKVFFRDFLKLFPPMTGFRKLSGYEVSVLLAIDKYLFITNLIYCFMIINGKS